MTLKDWIISASLSSSSSSTTTTTTTTSGSQPSILLMDGGVSTHLEHLLQQQQNQVTFSPRALWSSSLLLTREGRKIILQGHKDWLQSGSDILTTVTYQCHYGVVGNEPLVVSPEKMTELIEWGVQVAREAANEEPITASSRIKPYVVASSGCYGAALADGSEYTGNYPDVDFAGLVDFHQKKAAVLLMQKPDGLAIETIPSVEECSAVCHMLSSSLEPASTACCWISIACKDGKHLNEGKPLWDALEAMRDKDPDAKTVHAVGINCCDSANIVPLVEVITRHIATRGPRRGIVIYPNSGEEWDAVSATWHEGTGCTDSIEFSERIIEAVKKVKQTWKELGAGNMPKLIVGGCCRTSPATIATMRKSIDVWETQNGYT